MAFTMEKFVVKQACETLNVALTNICWWALEFNLAINAESVLRFTSGKDKPVVTLLVMYRYTT